MADYLTIKTLAENLNTEFNAISTELHTATTIDREIPFNIVDDIQDYEDNKTWSDDVVIPGIMIRLAGQVAPSQVHQAYTDIITVTVYGFKRELEDTKKVINTYIERNTGKFIKDSGWVYQLSFDRPNIIDRGIDEGEERVTIMIDITYKFIYGGYISDDITIKINGIEVPILSYVHSLVKEGKSSDTKSAGGVVTTRHTKSTITKTMKFIHVSNTALTSLHEDIDTGNFLNTSYTVFYGLGYDADALPTPTWEYDNTETMVVTSGEIEYIENSFQTIKATFLVYKDLS